MSDYATHSANHSERRSTGDGPGPQGPVAGVHLQFGAQPARSMVVSWPDGSGGRAPAMVCVGRRAGGPTVRVAPVTAGYHDEVSGRDVFVRHCQLDGLEPDTEYRYAIELAGRRSAVGSFRTAPERRVPFRFTACGDVGTPLDGAAPAGDVDPHCGPYQRVLVEEVERLGPLFHLPLGDLSYANESSDPVGTWRRFFVNASRSAARRPWMPCAGNHENEVGVGFVPYQRQFRLPGNGTEEWRGLWYSFRVGSVLVVALNNDDVCYQDGGRSYRRGYSGGRQRRWLEATLSAARRDPHVDWIVVAMHQPAVSSADHNGADLGIREEFLPLFDRFEVDLVLCAHEHNYERSHPLRGVRPASPTLVPAVAPYAYRPDGTVESSRGTVHVVVGGGGAGPSRRWVADRCGQPRGSVIVGTERPGRGGPAVKAREPAPWSAVRGDLRRTPFGLLVVDVDPGAPGGGTSLSLRAVAHSGAADGAGSTPFDHLTLIRRRPA